jgi:hypothetical protein
MKIFTFKISKFKTNQDGIAHLGLNLIIFSIVIFAVIGTFHSASNHVSGDILEIKSGISGQCLDDHDSSVKSGAFVDDHGCNDTSAQAWSFSGLNIKNGALCLAVQNNSKSEGAPVILNSCDDSSGQIWFSDDGGLYNPNSQMCLDEPGNGINKDVTIASCTSLSKANEIWSSSGASLSCNAIGVHGERVACYAVKEWEGWQSGITSHKSLLNTYTDGAPYEEWCADFVSYVYKESGYPFTGGEADGWDESNANLIQNQGFTIHSAANYTPKPGDIAYFNYTGGHVEIVVSGGKYPTFIYGNSAKIDPSTGNGEMEANTIIQDGSIGHLVYYLSPN